MEPLPTLPKGKTYYAVIDIEALVLGVADVIEQVGIVLVDIYGEEALGEKHMVFQPMDARKLAIVYGTDIQTVERAVEGYERITQDSYIHGDRRATELWGYVRERIVQICQLYAVAVYAKGMALESRVFYGDLFFSDLAWWGACKYPNPVHDPLSECRFFAQFIPDLIRRPVYVV